MWISFKRVKATITAMKINNSIAWTGIVLLLGFWPNANAAVTMPPAEPPAGAPRYVTDHVIIQFKDIPEVTELKDQGAAGFAQLVETLQLPAGSRLEPGMHANAAQARSAAQIRWMLLHLPADLSVEEAIDRIEGHPLVDYVEPDMIGYPRGVVPNDTYLHLQPHLLNRHFTSSAGRADVHAPEAWTMSQGSSNVVVAIPDSGINTNIADFSGRLLPGWNTITPTGSSDTTDMDGHGTLVASAGFATGNDSNAVAGIDWNCKVLPIRITDWNGNSTASGAARGIYWAVTNGADIISISWAFGDNSTLRVAINNAIAAGVPVVNAFGNSSQLVNLTLIPESIPEVIQVGGSDPRDLRIAFSTYGHQMDLMAPAGVLAHSRSGSLEMVWGTSFAAPQTAAAIALLASHRPGITPAEAKALLCASADDVVGDATDRLGHDIYHGWGRLNVARALRLLELGAGGMTNIQAIRDQFSPDVPEMQFPPLPSPETYPLPTRWETPGGHRGAVTCLAVSSNSQAVVTAGNDRRVLLWSLVSNTPPSEILRAAEHVMDLALANDGRTLALALADGTIRVSDLQGATPDLSIAAHTGRVTSVAFNPAGDRLVSGGNDGLVKVWTPTNGALLYTLTGHTGAVTEVVVTYDGARVVSGSLDKTLRRWNLTNGVSEGVLATTPEVVVALAASPSDNRVAYAYDDMGIIFVRDVNSGGIVGGFNATERVECLTFFANGGVVVSGDVKGQIQFWSLSMPAPPTITFGVNSVLALGVTPDGNSLIGAGLDQTIKVYALPSAALTSQWGGQVSVGHVSMTADGSRLAVRAQEGFSELDASDGTVAWEVGIGNQAGTTAVAYHPAGTLVATTTRWGGDIIIRFATNGVYHRSLVPHPRFVNAMGFTPDGTRFVSSGDEGLLVIWDASTWTMLAMTNRGLHEVFAPLNVLAFAPDSSVFVETTLSNSLQIFSATNAMLLRTFPPQIEAIYSAAFSPDGSTLAAASVDGSIRFYNVADGTLLRHVNDWGGPLKSLCFSPDGQFLAAGGFWETHAGIGVWRVGDGSFVGRFVPGTADPIGIESVSFTPDGRELIVGGYGPLLRLRADIPPARFTDITDLGSMIRLEWEGSYPRYDVQSRPVDTSGAWASVGAPVSGTTLDVINDGGSHLFRLEGLDP